MGVLDGTKVKIVITSEVNSSSEKLKYAVQNNIPCLKVEWVYESVEAGYSLPFANYLIKSTQACSTPEKTTGKHFSNLLCSFMCLVYVENLFSYNFCVLEAMSEVKYASHNYRSFAVFIYLVQFFIFTFLVLIIR